jgi:hypothetical protein
MIYRTSIDIHDTIKMKFSQQAKAEDLIDGGERPDECGSRSSA